MRDTPFEPLDDGVAIGEHSPRQDVPHSPKTEMLPIQGMPPSYPPHGQYVAEPARLRLGCLPTRHCARRTAGGIVW